MRNVIFVTVLFVKNCTYQKHRYYPTNKSAFDIFKKTVKNTVIKYSNPVILV